jgi:AraC-like DNA-binding protein
VAGIGAFLYGYVRSLTGLGNGWRQIFHFVPMLVFMALILQVKIYSPETIIQALNKKQIKAGASVPILVFQCIATAYFLAIVYRLYQYRARVHEQYSSMHQRHLAWLHWLTLAVALLLMLWFPAAQAGGPWLTGLVLGRMGLLYAFGWYGLRQQPVFLPALHAPVPVGPPPPVPVPSDPAPSPAAPVDAPAPASRYARSGMTAAAAELIGERLTRRMDGQRDYLENDLKLTELAERIGTSPQLLSEYLNVGLGLSFFDYVNQLRVDEVQRQMLAGDPTTNLLTLALNAGFNSKSTFNAAFKKASGTTPSAWRALNRRGRTSEPIGQDD